MADQIVLTYYFSRQRYKFLSDSAKSSHLMKSFHTHLMRLIPQPGNSQGGDLLASEGLRDNLPSKGFWQATRFKIGLKIAYSFIDMTEAMLSEKSDVRVSCRFAKGDRVRSVVPSGLEGVVAEWWADGFGGFHRVYVVAREENGNCFCLSQEHVELVESRTAA